ncbi:serine/arginine repetitive matrix protein 1-like [Palaemon carinicauda]|uniref:serine/arginine repetitive matrix protein 1-like n=1 Tax=Palaemon carinicauda TaxID=392227 RepID=UPI0035B5E76B
MLKTDIFIFSECWVRVNLNLSLSSNSYNTGFTPVNSCSRFSPTFSRSSRAKAPGFRQPPADPRERKLQVFANLQPILASESSRFLPTSSRSSRAKAPTSSRSSRAKAPGFRQPPADPRERKLQVFANLQPILASESSRFLPTSSRSSRAKAPTSSRSSRAKAPGFRQPPADPRERKLQVFANLQPILASESSRFLPTSSRSSRAKAPTSSRSSRAKAPGFRQPPADPREQNLQVFANLQPILASESSRFSPTSSRSSRAKAPGFCQPPADPRERKLQPPADPRERKLQVFANLQPILASESSRFSPTSSRSSRAKAPGFRQPPADPRERKLQPPADPRERKLQVFANLQPILASESSRFSPTSSRSSRAKAPGFCQPPADPRERKLQPSADPRERKLQVFANLQPILASESSRFSPTSSRSSRAKAPGFRQPPADPRERKFQVFANLQPILASESVEALHYDHEKNWQHCHSLNLSASSQIARFESCAKMLTQGESVRLQ